MNRKLIWLTLLLACVSAGARDNPSAQNTNIPFLTAKNYFIRNDYSGTGTVKIESNQAFQEVFGFAALMGKEGRPTPIDFSQQYVIAVISPITDRQTELIPKSLVRDKSNDVIFAYAIKKGGRMSFSTRPFVAIIVDKQYQGKVAVRPQEVAE